MSENKGILCKAIADGYYNGKRIVPDEFVHYTGALKPDSEGNLTVLPMWLIPANLEPEVEKEMKDEKLDAADKLKHLDYANPPPLEMDGKTLPKMGTASPKQEPPKQEPPKQETSVETTEGMTQDLPDQVQEELTGTKPQTDADIEANLQKMF